MLNVTISMDEETARWLRVEAAKAGKSVSRFVGDLLAERRRVQFDAEWEAGHEARRKAMEAFLASPARDLGLYGRGPTREETYAEMLHRHERSAVREGPVGSFEAEGGKALDRSSPSKKGGRAKRAKPA